MQPPWALPNPTYLAVYEPKPNKSTEQQPRADSTCYLPAKQSLNPLTNQCGARMGQVGNIQDERKIK